MEDKTTLINSQSKPNVFNAVMRDVQNWWAEDGRKLAVRIGFDKRNSFAKHTASEFRVILYDFQSPTNTCEMVARYGSPNSVISPFVGYGWVEGPYDDAVVQMVRAFEVEFAEACIPRPRPQGGWWADENLYLVRPLVKGEHAAFPPRPDWTVIDPLTYEKMNEVKRNDAPETTFHKSTIYGLRRAVGKRLTQWQASLRKDPTWYTHARVAYVSKSWDLDEKGEFRYQFESWGKAPSSFAIILGNVLKPFAPRVRLHGGELSQRHKDNPYLQRAISDLTDIVQPHVSSTGHWWADENYYPIRPVLDGESEDLKPIETWTIVSGASGEVVSEGVGGLKDPKAKIALKINPASTEPMRAVASIRLDAWCVGLENDDIEENVINLVRCASARKSMEAEFHAPWKSDLGYTFTLHASWYHPLQPTVKIVPVEYVDDSGRRVRGSFHPEMPKKLGRYLERSMLEVISPEPHSSGLWWADENLYAVRPFFEGEVQDPPPREGWTLIDPFTHEQHTGELKGRYDLERSNEPIVYVHTFDDVDTQK